MKERPPVAHTEKQEAMLLVRIKQLRNFVLSSDSILQQWGDELFQWDKNFKIALKEKYGSTQYAQQVPEWQTLVGGTPEEETDITADIRLYIVGEVEQFVDGFSKKYTQSI